MYIHVELLQGLSDITTFQCDQYTEYHTSDSPGQTPVSTSPVGLATIRDNLWSSEVVRSSMGALLSFLGDLYAILSQAFPPRTTFSVDKIPDLTGRVVVVTG